MKSLGVDLRELVCEESSITPRYVITLIEQHRHNWSMNTHLLALIADVLAGANWQRGGGKGKRPKPIPRPNERATKRVVRVADVLKAQKQRQE